jgi:hypothetical protein
MDNRSSVGRERMCCSMKTIVEIALFFFGMLAACSELCGVVAIIARVRITTKFLPRACSIIEHLLDQSASNPRSM